MRKDTNNFIKSAEYDLNTAEFMLKSGRYIYVIFMCHLSLEKMLKAIVTETTQKISPRSHNLIYLLKLVNTQLPTELFNFIAKINNASILTRYPETFQKYWKPIPKAWQKNIFLKLRRFMNA